MEPLTLALTSLTARLIATGVAGAKAHDAAGWGKEEATAFEKAIGLLPAFSSVLREGTPTGPPLVKYCEVITLAFGEAWRRHWHYDENLAPAQFKARWWHGFGGKYAARRIQQIEARLTEGRLEEVTLGEGAPLEELRLLNQLDEPLRSPWYASLWEAFARPSAEDESDDDGLPPLLLLIHGGASKTQFERHFKLAFLERLTAPAAAGLVNWMEAQLGPASERPLLIRRLLASQLLHFRREHVFGELQEETTLPNLPLEELYVEPNARRRRFETQDSNGGGLGAPEGILGSITSLLKLPETRLIVVLADFGRGKSLTARTLAYKFAENYLEDAGTPSPNVDYPEFVRCRSWLRGNALSAEASLRAAQKDRLSALLANVKKDDTSLGFPKNQNTVIFLDGLDEVSLSAADAKDLFDSLVDETNQEHRIVLFSRPGAVPASQQQLPQVTVLELEDFDQNQQEQWLQRWSVLAPSPHPSSELLSKRDLVAVCQVPVLLFMVAQTWGSFEDTETVRRADIYEVFTRLTARGKLENDQKYHPVQYEGAVALAKALSTRIEKSVALTPEDALLDLFSRLAWRAMKNRQGNRLEHDLTTYDVDTELKELGVSEARAEIIQQGTLLALSTSLSGGTRAIHFSHESFGEFLTAKYWESRLLRIARSRASRRESIETELYGARLLLGNSQNTSFLRELLGKWKLADQLKLHEWAEDTFSSEVLSAKTLREDERYVLREAALFIGDAVSAKGMLADNCQTLATLLASFQARGTQAIIHAPRLKHVGAKLRGAQLTFARLQGAELRNADLSCAHLLGANLQGTNLQDADLTATGLQQVNLRGANLQDAHLLTANLSGANLRGANLQGAYPQGADFTGAHFTGANLQFTNFLGAKFEDANFQNADLRGADLTATTGLTQRQLDEAFGNEETRLPDGFTIPRFPKEPPI